MLSYRKELWFEVRILSQALPGLLILSTETSYDLRSALYHGLGPVQNIEKDSVIYIKNQPPCCCGATVSNVE